MDFEISGMDNAIELEKGVHELQVAFSDPLPSMHQMKEEIVLKGTLFYGHTAHHRRRVLMSVSSWRIAGLTPFIY